MLAASQNDGPSVWPTNSTGLIQAKGRMRQSRGDVGGGEEEERRTAYRRAMKELLERHYEQIEGGVSDQMKSETEKEIKTVSKREAICTEYTE